MAMSAYSDVHPAIKTKLGLEKFRSSLFPDCDALLQLAKELESLKLDNSTGDSLEWWKDYKETLNNEAENVTGYHSVNQSKTTQDPGGHRTNKDDALLLLLMYKLLSESKESENERTQRVGPSQKRSLDEYPHSGPESDLESKLKNGGYDKSNQSTKIALEDVLLHTSDQNTTFKNSIHKPIIKITTPSIFVTTTKSSSSTTTTTTAVTLTTLSPLGNVTINTRPIFQATERWVAYNLMTLNLSLTLALSLERCLALTFPFRVVTWLTPSRTMFAVFVLVVLTLIFHTPQFAREITMALQDPQKVMDDFEGTMLQSFRRDYELVVIYMTSGIVLLSLASSLLLLRFLADYRSKVKHNVMYAHRCNIDVNVTICVLLFVLLQTPHAVAMVVISFMSLQDLVSHTKSFTQAVVLVRLLYVTNSALAHSITYCLMARNFRRKLRSVGSCCSGCRQLCCKGESVYRSYQLQSGGIRDSASATKSTDNN